MTDDTNVGTSGRWDRRRAVGRYVGRRSEVAVVSGGNQRREDCGSKAPPIRSRLDRSLDQHQHIPTHGSVHRFAFRRLISESGRNRDHVRSRPRAATAVLRVRPRPSSGATTMTWKRCP